MRARALPLLLPLLVAACHGGSDPRPYAEALARHDAYGYSVDVTLHDPGCALGDVTLTAPSGFAATPLCFDGKRAASFPIGTSTPEDFPIFEWRVNATGEAILATVECWQHSVPAPVDVVSPATSPVALRWAGLGTGYDYLVAMAAGGLPSERPEDAVGPPLRDALETSVRLPASPNALAFRVMGGPAGWTTHAASSCYAVSDLSALFVVQ